MARAFVEERWLANSVLCFRDYNLNKLLHDLIAGVTVGPVVLPLAMAFSIASGLSPQAGIYCAILTGFLISLLVGRRRKIGGPRRSSFCLSAPRSRTGFPSDCGTGGAETALLLSAA
jgi:SulP family sulfate permease